jgi:FkbM family methyltransferase
MDIQNQNGENYDINFFEKPEQDLVNQYIEENDVVLELGARFGSVSCIINSKLKNKTNQVVVEPDDRVWDALERNKNANKCEFHIIKGFVSSKKLELTNLWEFHGYGTTSFESESSNIPSISLDTVIADYNLKFNVLIADCEGFLETFFDENPNFCDGLRLLIYEADYPEKCNYLKIEEMLTSKQFTNMLSGHQNVWIK